MPSPKDGTPGLLVEPTEPDPAVAANDAQAGDVTQASGEGGSPPPPWKSAGLKPYKPPKTEEQKQEKTSWIEIKLVDEVGEPVPGEAFAVELPDQTVFEGTLDERGFARIDGIPPGNCKICFSRLDQDAWEPKS
jgi:hypothetical protein